MDLLRARGLDIWSRMPSIRACDAWSWKPWCRACELPKIGQTLEMGSPAISERQKLVPEAWKPWFMEMRTLIGPIKHWCNVLESLHSNTSLTLHSARVHNPLDTWKTYGNGLWWAFDMLTMEETLETSLILDIPCDKLYLFYSCSSCIKALCLYHILQIRFGFTPGWIVSFSVIGTK